MLRGQWREFGQDARVAALLFFEDHFNSHIYDIHIHLNSTLSLIY